MPKVLLHDHLDGGLRPETVIGLADAIGYDQLPTDDPPQLAQWFTHGADRKDLPKYLDGFRHTVAVMQTADALTRAARECVEDLADDKVAYAEVGFDIAGTEAGSPPARHLDAFDFVRHSNFHITIHAGEGFGLPSIWEALQWCGAERLGHGVRIVDDITLGADGHATLGPLAAYVRDRRIPLEMWPTSNVHTGASPSLASHPIDLLRRLGFRVTVNTDNRLMSDVTLSGELARTVEEFGYGWDDLQWLTINAMKSAFARFDERLELITNRIKPGFAAVRDEAAQPA